MSKIEWTDVTDNLFVIWNDATEKQNGWHCQKRSAGCKNCYAESLNMNTRFSGNTLPYSRSVKFNSDLRIEGNEHLRLRFKRGIVNGWARQRKPKMHFINSMSDTFGDWIPDEWIFDMLDGMIAAPMQTFQVLTKYNERMQAIVNEFVDMRGIDALPPNIWLMVTVENQAMADERLPYLRDTKVTVRGLSVEPMLSEVDLYKADMNWRTYIDWVICGGESGRGARPMSKDWATALRDDCTINSVPFLFKQWGAFNEDGKRVGKRKAGRLLEGRLYDGYPYDNCDHKSSIQEADGRYRCTWLCGQIFEVTE